MSEYIHDGNNTLEITVEFSLTGGDEITTRQEVTRLDYAELDLCITEAGSAFLGLISNVALPDRDDEADQHPWMSFKLSLMHVNDDSLVTRNFDVSAGALIYSTDTESAKSKLGKIVNQVLPIFVRDLHGLGITLQEAS